MTPHEVVSPADALAISALSAEFGYLVDQKRATECEGLFAVDADLIFGPGSPKPGTLAGVEAIRGFLVARQALMHVTTRHVATNFRFEAQTDGSVKVTSLLTVFRSDDETREASVALVCDVAEVFTREAGGSWRIQERLTTPIFARS